MRQYFLTSHIQQSIRKKRYKYWVRNSLTSLPSRKKGFYILGASTALVKAKLLFDLVLQVIGLADPFPLNDFNNCLWSCPRAKTRLKTSNEMANLNFTKSYSCHAHQFIQLSTYLLADSVTIMILLPSLVGIKEVFIYGISKFLIQTWKSNDKKKRS